MFIVILSWGNNAYILFKKIQQNKKIEIKKWMWTPTVHPPPIAKSLTSISAVSFHKTQNLELDLTSTPLPSDGVSAALSSLKLKPLRSCFSHPGLSLHRRLWASSPSLSTPSCSDASQNKALNSKCAEFNFCASVLAGKWRGLHCLKKYIHTLYGWRWVKV